MQENTLIENLQKKKGLMGAILIGSNVRGKITLFSLKLFILPHK
jgi:hypothetical protein